MVVVLRGIVNLKRPRLLISLFFKFRFSIDFLVSCAAGKMAGFLETQALLEGVLRAAAAVRVSDLVNRRMSRFDIG